MTGREEAVWGGGLVGSGLHELWACLAIADSKAVGMGRMQGWGMRRRLGLGLGERIRGVGGPTTT